jgi:flagellar biosynthesis component FlhA
MHLLLLAIGLFVCLAIVAFFIGALPAIATLLMIFMGILLSLVALRLLHKQRRMLAFRADELMVTWLGRSHVCQGLHALADSQFASSHSRWGDPSLAERIERVCGTQVRAGDPRLIMVR